MTELGYATDITFTHSLFRDAMRLAGIRAAQERAEGRGLSGERPYRRTADGGYLGTAGSLAGDILTRAHGADDRIGLRLSVHHYVSAYVDEALRIRGLEQQALRALTGAWPMSDDEVRAEGRATRAELTEVALGHLVIEANAARANWVATVDQLRMLLHS